MTPKQKDQITHTILNTTVKVEKLLKDIEKAVNSISTKPCTAMKVKDMQVLKELTVEWHPKLTEVIEWLYKEHREQIMFTSGYRKEDGGIHGCLPLRAVDLRSAEFNNPQVTANKINRVWDYGDNKHSVCLYHRTGRCLACHLKFELDVVKGTKDFQCPACGSSSIKDFGPHFHIQVRDETKNVSI